MPDPCTHAPEIARLREALDKAERERDAAQAMALDRPMGALAAERIVAACERKIAAAERRAADAEAMAEAQRQLHAAALKERDEAEQRATEEAERADGLAEALDALARRIKQYCVVRLIEPLRSPKMREIADGMAVDLEASEAVLAAHRASRPA